MRATHWRYLQVAVSFGFYLLIMVLWPTHWATPLLGLAVVAAARSRMVPGALGAAFGAGLALGFGLWRMGIWPAGNPLVFSGYVWAWGATILLGVYVGHLTRQTRQLQLSNADLKQAQQRLAALHQIALSLSTTLDVNRLMELILDQLGRLWGYDYGSILLQDPETGDLVLAASRGYSQEPGDRQPASAGICGAVFSSGQPLCVPDVAKEPRYLPGLRGARSELGVPLIWENQVLGVLNVESRTPDAYGAADLTLLTTVAEQAAAAIGNARLHQQTHQMAITDGHTGLFNYRHFQEQMALLVRDSQLSGSPFALIMLDLDLFKRVNDTYGHPTGDAILQQVARILRDSCRSEDLLFRYGGEEFAIILPGSTGEAALLVADRVRERVSAYPFTTRTGRRVDFSITASLGVAAYPKDGLTHVDLVIAADKALYAAKTAGRNQVAKAGQGQIETA